MVAKASSLGSKKRKKTADMPDSPPKRVTRARAKATEDNTVKATTKKITTASARAATQSKKPIKSTKPAKPRTRADDDANIEERNEEEAPIESTKQETPKTRRKTPKSMEKGGPAMSTANASIRATRKQDLREEVPAAEDNPSKKPRGRPRKILDGSVKEASENTAEGSRLQPSRQTTRKRGGISTTSLSITTKPSALAPKKKVTFQNEAGQDKENEPIEQGKLKENSARPSGLRAKPVRKPATTRITAPGRKATDTKAKGSSPTSITQPLSPKKITQVAKTSSVSSEDEICGAKTPVRALSRSPTKSPVRMIQDDGSKISKLDFTLARIPDSPTKSPVRDLATSIFTSPARRLLSSPYKDALKDSPKRINFAASIPQLTKEPTQSPLKASLLQSPARRPTSPLKMLPPGRPGTANASAPNLESQLMSCHKKDFTITKFTPRKLNTSPLRAINVSHARIDTSETSFAEKIRPQNAEASTVTAEDNPEEAALKSSISLPTKPSKDRLTPCNLPASPNGVSTDTSPKLPFDASQPLEANDIEHAINDQGPSGADSPDRSVPAAFSMASVRYTLEESDSDDELQSTSKASPNSATKNPPGEYGAPGSPTPVPSDKTPKSRYRRQSSRRFRRSSSEHENQGQLEIEPVSMTPLAMQLSSWFAASPEKRSPSSRNGMSRGIFSLPRSTFPSKVEESSVNTNVASSIKPSFFDDEMAVRDEEDEIMGDAPGENEDNDVFVTKASQESQESDQYGDENLVPIDPQLLEVQQIINDETMTCTPARVFYKNPREVHTVSKVPLRPPAEESPTIRVPRKRSRSVSVPLAILKESFLPGSVRDGQVEAGAAVERLLEDVPPNVGGINKPVFDGSVTPKQMEWSQFVSPAKTVRKGADAEILQGAVIYVDVHTTEGADASGIFVELLTQMGARCVKQWAWNPRSSGSDNLENATSKGSRRVKSPTSAGKTGITHVVYKDGGVRTLEKLRASKGSVLCVGVGWVLDCERENKWLDEADYTVDVSLVPRGGHRRRKSMEPRMLSNNNGQLVPADTSARETFLSPTKEFLNLSSPPSRRDSALFEFTTSPEPVLGTPIVESGSSTANLDTADEESSLGSPATPYYLSKGAQLVQMTCPPKQQQQLLFPLSGRIEDQPDEGLKRKLELARRRSLMWAPRVGSPLGKQWDG